MDNKLKAPARKISFEEALALSYQTIDEIYEKLPIPPSSYISPNAVYAYTQRLYPETRLGTVINNYVINNQINNYIINKTKPHQKPWWKENKDNLPLAVVRVFDGLTTYFYICCAAHEAETITSNWSKHLDALVSRKANPNNIMELDAPYGKEAVAMWTMGASYLGSEVIDYVATEEEAHNIINILSKYSTHKPTLINNIQKENNKND